MAIYAEERQEAIARLVSTSGRVSVARLAAEFDVTTETVRRDLSILERARVLRRVHGGAVPAEALTVIERALNDRDHANTDQKDRIAAAAVEQLPPAGGSVLLDAGSTTARLADRLPPESSWTVITHAVPIAARLATAPHVDLHLLPGHVRRSTQAAVGEDTVDALRRIRADVTFLGTNGFTLDHGCSTPDASEAATKRQLVRSGHKVVVLADATKFGQESTVRFADLDDIDVLVTDRGAPRDVLAALREHGIEVVEA